MRLSAIVCCDANRGIGKDNGIPWPRLKADMARFREVTMGKPMIMGRATWESIGKPLPGRTSIVLSQRKHEEIALPSGVKHAIDINHAIRIAAEHGEEGVVIGGGFVFGQLLDRCERVYLTALDASFDCDTFFNMGPEMTLGRVWGDKLAYDNLFVRSFHWRKVEETRVVDEPSGIRMVFQDFVREKA